MTAPHLGGSCGQDQVDPVVLGYLARKFGVRSMLDIGCGLGGTVKLARSYGLDAIGVDGDEEVRPDILHDFTTGPWPPAGAERPVDLVWSVEFVEHVEEQYVPNFLRAFAQGRVVFMTHAVPGQQGWHHVTLREQWYWLLRLSEVGLLIDPHATREVRQMATNEYCRATGMVLLRQP